MPRSEHEPALGKILVALDATSSGVETLTAAAELAAQLQAELQGLFVEDINLLRVAALPFAQEIGLASAALRPLTQDVMERTLRGVADQVRLTLAELADRLQVPWSFQVTRGNLIRLPWDFLEAADLLILGSQARMAPRGRRTAPAPRTGPLLVLYDGSPASERALTMALDLTCDRPGDLVVLLGGDEPEEALRTRVKARLREGDRETLVPALSIATSEQLLDAVRQRHARLLLLGRDARLLDEATLESLVKEVGCPVGLLR